MKNKFIISLIVVTLIVVGTGFIFLNNGETPQVEEDPLDNSSDVTFPSNFTGMNPMANRTNIMSQIIFVINGSDTNEEILGALNNMTKMMNETFGKMPFQSDRVNPFIAFFEELEDLTQEKIDEGATVEKLKDTIIQKVKEYIDEMESRTPFRPQ